MEWIVWLTLGIIAVTFQLYSALTGTKWGMLTHSIRWLRVRLWGRLVILPAWTWLTWHWFLEPQALSTVLWPDIVAILVGVAAALIADYHDYDEYKHELSKDNRTP